MIRAAWVLLVSCCWWLSSSPCVAAAQAVDASAPVAARFGGRSSALAGDALDTYGPRDRRAFVAGGVSFLTSQSLVNAWVTHGWNVTAGLDLPTRWTWTLVPRAHYSDTRAVNAGRIACSRLAFDARESTRSWDGIHYAEVGLGLGLFDSPVSVTDTAYNSHIEQRRTVVPFAQAVFGLRGDPSWRFAPMLEAVVVLGLGNERPGGIELAAGVQF